jgi:hypothetical protein
MEFKLRKEVDNKVYRVETKEGILIKPYLTIEEMQNIINDMINETDVLVREVIYVSKLLEYCTNVDMTQFEKENGDLSGDEIYNFVISTEVTVNDEYPFTYDLRYALENCIINAERVLELIQQIEGADNVLRKFVSSIEPKIDEMVAKLDMNKLQESIVEMQNLSNITVK